MMIVFGWMFESVFLESWGLSVRGIDDYEVTPKFGRIEHSYS